MADIIAASRRWNNASSLTGALIFTGEYFAHYIEGDEKAIDQLKLKIRRDPRHTDIVTLSEGPISQRRFARWAIAYAGASQYVAQAIALPLREIDRPGKSGVNKLLRLMDEFVSQDYSHA